MSRANISSGLSSAAKVASIASTSGVLILSCCMGTHSSSRAGSLVNRARRCSALEQGLSYNAPVTQKITFLAVFPEAPARARPYMPE